MPEKSGPFVQAACFCDNVIEDKIGVLSLIRVIDSLNITVSDPTPPDDMPRIQIPLNMVLMLQSGGERGRFDLRIVLENPSGISHNVADMSIHFEEEGKGSNVISKISGEFSMEGLHWFKVYLDDDLLTAMPFRIKYSRIRTEVG